MRIVDIDIDDIFDVVHSIRSEETKQLVAAIKGLNKGQALAITLDEQNTQSRIKSKLIYAAKIANVKLDMVSDSEKIMFSLNNGKQKSKQKKQ